MTKLLYCAQPEGDRSDNIPAEELSEIFALSQRHPTSWDAELGQYVPNPHYVEDAFLEWSDDLVAILVSELNLPGLDPAHEAQAWPLGSVRSGIDSFRQASQGVDPDGLDSAICALDRLTALGARHGATHLVSI